MFEQHYTNSFNPFSNNEKNGVKRVNQTLLYLPCFVPRPGATWRPPRFVSAATVVSAREDVALFPPSVSDAQGRRSVTGQRFGLLIDYRLDPILYVQHFLFWNLKYELYVLKLGVMKSRTSINLKWKLILV